MKAALLALLLALPCAAQDAPLPEDFPATGPDIVHRRAGEPAPFDGVLLSDAMAKVQAQRILDAEARPSWVVVLVAAGVCLGGGIALGVVIARR